jgi:EAL domain-containing protein (putative c-di-GMP-specific phosphodiesterase class I)
MVREILEEEIIRDFEKGLREHQIYMCYQPKYNHSTGRMIGAEALMRWNHPVYGKEFPGSVIALIEEHGLIHTLTEIVLHKTCEAIRGFCEDGYQVRRISVNVSAIELKCDAFCDDVMGIIAASGIPGDRIAIELTESRTDSDFDQMKLRIEELRQHGIKFYLDDFGTGYSNMERIMELPFDIIKFDRSLVLASGADERSEKIVENLANMFRDMNYSVLYEGVEDESDEARCRGMSASYLQGYKYSRPVPIERLREFLPKISG